MTEPSEITTALAVIDATLGGEAVEPEYAELAELSLILAAMGQAPRPEFAADLDRRVERRFTSEPASDPSPARTPRWRWLFAPGAAIGVAAVIALVVVLGGGSTDRRPPVQDLSAPGIRAAAGRGLASAPGAASSGASASAPSSTAAASAAPRNHAGIQATDGPNYGTLSRGLVPAVAPTPPTAGRQIVQSAQLSLSTPANRIDAVAQQVFDVVATENGVVQNSNVSSSTGYGNAQFSLSVPSANLSRALNALSQLHGANVVSRSDASQDITGQVGGAGRRLGEARALRTSLLRQLAAATTAATVSSLKAQINDVDATINRDLGALGSLVHKVAYSQISVTINSVTLPGQPVTHGGGFTLSRAAHDAGRVLVVVAGVALIALAGLVPLTLLAGVGVWLAAGVRRRRREQALDLI